MADKYLIPTFLCDLSMKLQELLNEAVDENDPAIKWFRQFVTAKSALRVKDGVVYYKGQGFSIKDVDDFPYKISMDKSTYLWISEAKAKTIDGSHLPAKVLRISFGDSQFEYLPSLADKQYSNISIYNLPHLTKLPSLPKEMDGILSIKNLPKIKNFKDLNVNEARTLYAKDLDGLTSFDGIPKKVSTFYVGQLGVKSFSGLHKLTSCNDVIFEKGSNLEAGLLSLLKMPSLDRIGYSIDESPLTKAIDIVNKYFHDRNIVECQSELIEAGLDDYAKL